MPAKRLAAHDAPEPDDLTDERVVMQRSAAVLAALHLGGDVVFGQDERGLQGFFAASAGMSVTTTSPAADAPSRLPRGSTRACGR